MKIRQIRLHSNAGFSLPGVLILITALAVMIYGFLKSQSFTIQIQNLIRSKRSSQDALQAFEAALIGQFRVDACLNPATVFSASSGSSISGAGTIEFATTVLTGVNLSGIVPEGLRNTITAAKTRCQSPRTSDTQSVSHRYFCVVFKKNGSSSGGSFFSSGAAFAEVKIESADFRTGQTITCAQANALPSLSGARMIYSIYWPARSAEGDHWQQLNGAINVAKL